MNDHQFGFKSGDLEIVIQVLSRFPKIEKAVIFGSRAKGSNQTGSDVDIAIWTINTEIIGQVSGILNDETLLPYKFDVLDYHHITNTVLKQQIDKSGIKVYPDRL